MSYADFLAACAEIDAADVGDFSGPTSEELVASAEAAIGFTFPRTFREFLLRYGSGGMGGCEFYGLTRGDLTRGFQNSGIPSAIWLALNDRKEWQFPHHLLVVYELGDGSKSCLDFSQRRQDGECPIVIWHPISEPGDRLEVEAEDFGQLLWSKIKEVRS